MKDERTTRLLVALTTATLLGCVTGCGEPEPPGQVTGTFGTIGGGVGNETGDYATVCGGSHNAASAYHATIGGGSYNAASVGHSVVGGGRQNTASGSMATVGGGWANAATHVDGTVGGGRGNTAGGRHATVCGGLVNKAQRGATIGGGSFNTAGANAAIGGGSQNEGGGFHAAIAGGAGNEASANYATIAGGLNNSATAIYANAAGGRGNRASGDYATVAGGFYNEAAGDFSFASGRRATVAATHPGAFLHADSHDSDFLSAAADEFAVRATGGVRLVTGIDSSGSPLVGAELPAGSGSWSSLSDRAVKANVAPADASLILSLLAELPISTWNYAGQHPSIRHIGPMAQDFHAAFSVGEDERHISTVDGDGVALAAIQALYRLVQERDVQIAALEARVAALEGTSRMNSPAPCTEGRGAP
ncbi:MAG: tail fiber domain-containing protein [Anaerolineae bacterium]|jgi:hypothetical protein